MQSSTLSTPLHTAIHARPWLATLAAVCAFAIFTPLLVFAQAQGGGPPTMPLPSTTADNAALLAQFWGWAKYLLGILAVLIAAGAFLWIASAVIGKFGEIVENRGNLLSIIPTVGLGLLVLALAGVLITLGWNVLKNTTLTP